LKLAKIKKKEKMARGLLALGALQYMLAQQEQRAKLEECNRSEQQTYP
jgi:hypothetical protein